MISRTTRFPWASWSRRSRGDCRNIGSRVRHHRFTASRPGLRVNTFIHVNHAANSPRYGVLMCVNGTGILYSWLRRLLVGDSVVVPYEELNRVAAQAPLGSDGLVVLPYGNGAERTLENRNPGPRCSAWTSTVMGSLISCGQGRRGSCTRWDMGFAS